MATFTYKCSDCGNIFNVQATIQENEAKTGEKFICLKCKSKNIKQKISITNFIKNIFTKETKPCCSCLGGGKNCGKQNEKKGEGCCR